MTESQEDASLDEAIDASLENVRLQEIDPDAATSDNPSLVLGTVVGVSDSDVIVELGPRSQGAVPVEEFEEPPEVGAKLRVAIRGREGDLLLLSVREAKALAAWDTMEQGSHVKAQVIGLNKGGLECKVGSISAFMPASQVALKRIDDLESLAGQILICEVTEIDREKKRVVLSRRRILEIEADRQREEGLDSLVEGSVARGKVVRMESFGAFVDIGHGIEGMVHVSNISHRRVGRPEEILRVGQEVEVQILEIKEGGKRIGLGMKQLEPDPWDDVQGRFHVDAVFTGKVRRLADFGAFVELVPGVEGLLHVSQFGEGRVRHARDVLKEGQEITVRVSKLDLPARRVSLSRYDTGGMLLGSDSAADGGLIDEVLSEGSSTTFGNNLGAIFKKALKKDE